MNSTTLRVGIDVGSVRHRVAVGLPDGTLIDEFDVDHHAAGFNQFFHRIAALEARHPFPVSVAMESYNGWTRPLDGLIRQHENSSGMLSGRLRDMDNGASPSRQLY
ncbi:MAG: hypothetical protein Q8K12_04715 [Thiobacillus sp.]|nr:hypothetical protein [Thiobacillus sp.]